MPVWNVLPINLAPEVELTDWAVFELENGDRHFAGYNITHSEGRASSLIVSFDKTNMTGITSSGRVYSLVGKPGIYGDGLYVWGRWCNINSVDPQTVKNISNLI